jgi:crotonobetaine/carnitine-CoA ligase
MRLYDLSVPQKRIIGAVLREQADRIGDDPWLVSDDRAVNFGAANDLVNRYANGLESLGVVQGSVVAMLMDPSIEVVLLAVAVAKLGGIFTTISTDFSGRFLEEALLAAGPAVLIIDEGFALRLEPLSGLLGVRILVHGAGSVAARAGSEPLQSLLQSPTREPVCRGHWLEPVQVWWSSGTTGKPKGITHSHSSLLMQTVSHDRDIRSGDTLYSCTPVYLGSSWTGTIWPSLVTGVRGAIDAKFSVSRFWERVNYYRATHAFTLGAMHMHLWTAPPAERDADNSLRRFAAIPMSADLIPAFKKRFGIENMHQGYGTSETFRVFDAPEDGEEHSGAILGRPVPHLEIALLDEDDQPVAVGDAGEICVRPRAPGLIFCGYFRDPQRTSAAWRSLWHHTGDMAFKDTQGLYRFADRKQDYIRYKGRNISMFEVEAVVANHAAVADVAAFGIPSAELESESELMLAVVLKPTAALTPEQLASYINAEAPHYFVPRYIDLVSHLERNAHGRLVKGGLKARGVTVNTWDRVQTGFQVRRP